MKFSADGRHLVANEQESHQVHAFDARDGKRVATFRDLPGGKAVAFAPLPDGKVAVAAHEPVVIVWDPATGKAERFPVPNPPPYYDATASRDGRYLLLTGPGRVVVLDFDSPGRPPVDRPAADIPSAVLAADGSRLLATDPDGTVHVLQLPGGRSSGPLSTPFPGVAAQAWDPAKGLLAVRRTTGNLIGRRIEVVDADTTRPVKALPGEYEPAAPRFAPDGRFLYAAAGPVVEVWDTATWEKVMTADVPRGPVLGFDVAPDGRTLAVTADRKVRLFALADDRFAVKPPAAGTPGLKEAWAAPFDVDPERSPRWVRFAPDGSRVVTPAEQAAVTHTFDAATGKRLATLTEPAGRQVAAFPLPGGKVFTHATDAPAARIWAADTGRELDTVPVPHDGRCQLLGLSPDGRHALLRRNRASELAVLDTRSGRAAPLVDGLGPARLSPDGAAVLVAVGARAMVFATADGRRTTAFDLPALRWQAAALSPDRRTAALLPTATADDPAPPLHLFDVTAGKPVRTIPGLFARTPTAVGYSPDGRFLGATRLLTPTGEFAFEVYDTTTWAVVARAADPVAAGGGFDFAPDGRRVVVWAADDRLRAYDLAGDRASPAPAAVAASRPARKPVPDPGAVAKADALARETYKADFAKRAPADRMKLIDKLAAEARQTADPAGQYALLRIVTGLATESAQLRTATGTVEAIGLEFDIDTPAEVAAAAEKAAGAATSAAQHREVAEEAGELAEVLVGKDEYDLALKLAAIATAAWGKANQPGKARDAADRRQQFEKLRDEFAPVRRAAEALKANPADPAAALAVGRHRALTRRWEDALPLLAAGSDPKLRALAKQDLKAATDTETTDLRRGDAWEEYARGQPEAEQAAYLARAKHWYTRVLSAQRGGLEVEAAKAKLAFTHSGKEYTPGLIAEYLIWPQFKVRKKTRVELAVDFNTRDHTDMGNGMKVVWAGVLVPPAAGRYKLIADTTDPVEVRLHSNTDVNVVIGPRGGAPRREAMVPFTGEKPVQIWVEYAVHPERGKLPNHTFALKWVRPGAAAAEVIPPGAFFCPKREAEKLAAGEK